MADLEGRRPCGRRDPDCPRPEYCEECFPRDRRQLHERILTHCNPAWYGIRDGDGDTFGLIRTLAAIRAAVEVCVDAQVEGVDGRFVDADTVPPSRVLAAIAREFRIEIGPPPTDEETPQ